MVQAGLELRVPDWFCICDPPALASLVIGSTDCTSRPSQSILQTTVIFFSLLPQHYSPRGPDQIAVVDTVMHHPDSPSQLHLIPLANKTNLS